MAAFQPLRAVVQFVRDNVCNSDVLLFFIRGRLTISEVGSQSEKIMEWNDYQIQYLWLEVSKSYVARRKLPDKIISFFSERSQILIEDLFKTFPSF